MRRVTVLVLLVFSGAVMAASAQTPSSRDHSPLDSSIEEAQGPEGFDLQGHRGARGLAPENTMPAFRRALEIGVTTLELDVVISRDGHVVVSHEPWMSSTICQTPSGKPIAESEEREHRIYKMEYDQVAKYNCGARSHPRFPEQTLQSAPKPLLRDVIERAEAYVAAHDRGPVFYNVETKIRPAWEGEFTPPPDPFARAVIAVLRETGVAPRAIIQSFDPRTLEVVHRLDPAVRIALLIGQETNQGLRPNLKRLSFRPDIYSPAHPLVDADLIDAARQIGETEKNLLVIPWTVNEKSDMRRLIDLGVDGLITDYPNRAVDVLGW